MKRKQQRKNSFHKTIKSAEKIDESVETIEYIVKLGSGGRYKRRISFPSSEMTTELDVRSSTKSVKSQPTMMKSSVDSTAHVANEMKKLLKSDIKKHGISIEPHDDNIFKWNVYLFDFDSKSALQEYLHEYAALTSSEPHVKLEVTFPPNFPSDPPFIRVVSPRFHQYTGHITIGGSICILDLTKSGWNPNNEISTFFIMIRNLLVEGGALVDVDNLSEYSQEEAMAAFMRVAAQHGWIY